MGICGERDQALEGLNGHSQEIECYLEGTQKPWKGFEQGSDMVYTSAAHTFILHTNYLGLLKCRF